MTESERFLEQKKEEKNLKDYIDFQKVIEEAVDDFIHKRYAKLFNAFKKYSTPNTSYEAQFEELRECWGNGFISDRTFNKLDELFKAFEEDGLARCVDQVLFMFDKKISDTERRIQELKKLKGWAKEE